MTKVLVIDDEPAHCALVARIMGEAGYDVVMTTSVARAIGHIDSGERFDIALVDMMMPEMAGTEFAAALRRHQPDVPVVFVTGIPDALFDEQPVLWDRQSFLEKPFSRAGLLEAVSMALYGTTTPPSQNA